MSNTSETVKVIIDVAVLLAMICIILFGSPKLFDWYASKTANITNDEVIREVKKCEDAGMRAVTLHSGLDFGIRAVNCEPKL